MLFLSNIWCLSAWWVGVLMIQTWKLKEDNSLLDMVDPELVEYPEDEVSCFIKVALLCIQAVSWQRPTMTQVLQMLSKEVSPDSMALTRPGYYKHSDGGIGHSWMTSSEVPKRKQLINPLVTSTRVSSCSVSITQVLPRWKNLRLVPCEQDLIHLPLSLTIISFAIGKLGWSKRKNEKRKKVLAMYNRFY